MELFDEVPYLEGEKTVIRPLVKEDAPALGAFTREEAVYRTLPTFLFEKKYDDPAEVIARLEEECFRPKESILLAVCPKEEPEKLVGLAEIYHWRKERQKASVGCRLSQAVWSRGYCTEAISLMKEYLLSVGIIRITAHILTDNIGSCRAVEKNGFYVRWTEPEDWGFKEPVLAHTYYFKKQASGQ